MAAQQNRISTFANPDPRRIRPAGTIAPEDMEIAAQFPGLSVSAPGTLDILQPPGLEIILRW
jgi:hypothetical protein